MYIKRGFHWDLWSLEFWEQVGNEMPIKLKTSNNHNPCKTVFKATNIITAFIKENTSE
jgi:hypothetical protein